MNKRLDEIETKITLLEQTVEESNDVIVKQDKILYQQESQLKLLYQKIKALPADSGINRPDEEPLPPHY